MTLGRSDDFHFLPVIGKLFAAVEAGDISSGESGRLRAPFRAANGDRKAVASVPAAKKCIYQFFNHDPPSIPERVCQVPGLVRMRAASTESGNAATRLLRFTDCPKRCRFSDRKSTRLNS